MNFLWKYSEKTIYKGGDHINTAIIIGNLTKDPDMRTTTNGISVTTFTLAVNRPYAKDETDFIPVVTWRTLAENCGKFLAKGRKCAVRGRIQTRSYDANDGTKRYVTEIVADEVQFLDKSREVDTGRDDAPMEPIDEEELPF